MNQKIILAVSLLALSSAAAAAESSVTLYGLVDSGLGYRKVNAPGFNQSQVGVVSGGESQSRWGLRGTEDLGGGLQAVFNLENGFTTNGETSQNGRLFGRRATIGLRSEEWGGVDLGRQINVASNYYIPIDPFGLGFTVANLGVALSAADTERLDNSVVYQSPKFNGFDFSVGYSFNVNDASSAAFETANNVREITAGVRYSSGPLYIVATYDQLNGNNATKNIATPKMYSIGGKYDFGFASLSLAYAHTADGWFATTAPDGSSDAKVNIPTNAFVNGFAANSYVVGIKLPIGGVTDLLGSWQHIDPNNTKLTGGDQNMNVYSLGAMYNLSKRTNLYAYLSETTNYAFLPDVKTTAMGIGVRHRF